MTIPPFGWKDGPGGGTPLDAAELELAHAATGTYTDAETTRAQAAEGTNSAAITAETTRAQAAEATRAQGLTSTAVKTAGYTAAAGEWVPCDVTGGGFTVTLPTAPPDKTRIGMKIVANNATPNSLTIARGGTDVFNIAAGSTSLTLTAKFSSVVLQYTASTGIWYVQSMDSATGNAGGAASLDATGRLITGQVPLSVVSAQSVAANKIPIATGANTAVFQTIPIYVESYRVISANDAAMWANATNAATNAGTTGGKVVGGGITYNFSAGSVPTIPAGLPSPLRIDLAGSTIKLSAAVPRPFDAVKALDGLAVTGTISNASPTVTGVTGSQAGVKNGMVVSGTSIPGGTTLLSGAGTSTWTLSANAIGAATETLTVDSIDTFQNIEISGGTIDQNNVGGHNHAIFGNYRAGAAVYYENWDRLYFHDIKVINAPVDSTLTQDVIAVRLGLSGRSGRETTQVTATNIRFERIDVSGANMAIFIGGGNTTPNAWIDNIVIDGLDHDLGSVAGSNFAAGHIQIGQNVLVGSVRIANVAGFNAADTGIEVDNALDLVIEKCKVVDSYTYPFFVTNFNITPNPNGLGTDWSVLGQRIVHRDCYAYRHGLIATSSSIGRGFGIGDNALAQGTVIYEGCHHWRTAPDGIVGGEGFVFQGDVRRVVLRECSTTIENITTSAIQSQIQVYANFNGANTTTLKIRGLKVTARSTTGITSQYGWNGVRIDKAAAGLLHLDIDDITYDVNLAVGGGGSVTNMNALLIGQSGTTHADGMVSRLRYPTFTGYSGRFCAWVFGTATLTINTVIEFRECDFTNGQFGSPTPGGEVNFSGTSNGAKCRFIDCVWQSNVSPNGRFASAADGSMTYATRLWAVTSTAAARTITLPALAAIPPGDFYEVVDESNAAGTNNITVQRAGADTWLGGGTSKTIAANGGSLRFYNNGTLWIAA